MLDMRITEISILPIRVPNQQRVVISHIWAVQAVNKTASRHHCQKTQYRSEFSGMWLCVYYRNLFTFRKNLPPPSQGYKVPYTFKILVHFYQNTSLTSQKAVIFRANVINTSNLASPLCLYYFILSFGSGIWSVWQRCHCKHTYNINTIQSWQFL